MIMQNRWISLFAGATMLAPMPAVLLTPAAAQAQSLAERIAAAPAEATVRFSYASKPGVCGDGERISIRDASGEGSTMTRSRRNTVHSGRWDSDWMQDCVDGPVEVEVERSGGRITDVHPRVGGEPRTDGTSFGTVSPDDAVQFLLSPDVLRNARERAADQMIFSSILADTESWPGLLRVAQLHDLSSAPRKAAVFWLAQAAGEKATEGLRSIIGDDSDELEVRKQAVFALSQIHSDETIDALIEIARTNREPEIRKNAMFWLGQTGSPRAIAFFEEILRG
jgi:HEAT repeats